MNKLIFPFLIFILLLTTSLAFAKDSSQSAIMENVSYDIPYPGILPDNPLYFLKAVRDNLIGYLITDSVKKAEYNLLQSDKRLAASQKLLEEGKINLSVTTLSKSGNYFYNAIEKAADAKNKGQDANLILDKLLQASKKHQKIIFEMTQSLKGDKQKMYVSFQERARLFQKKVEQIKSK